MYTGGFCIRRVKMEGWIQQRALVPGSKMHSTWEDCTIAGEDLCTSCFTELARTGLYQEPEWLSNASPETSSCPARWHVPLLLLGFLFPAWGRGRCGVASLSQPMVRWRPQACLWAGIGIFASSWASSYSGWRLSTLRQSSAPIASTIRTREDRDAEKGNLASGQ